MKYGNLTSSVPRSRASLKAARLHGYARATDRRRLSRTRQRPERAPRRGAEVVGTRCQRGHDVHVLRGWASDRRVRAGRGEARGLRRAVAGTPLGRPDEAVWKGVLTPESIPDAPIRPITCDSSRSTIPWRASSTKPKPSAADGRSANSIVLPS